MFPAFEEIQKYSKDSMEQTVQSLGAVSKSAQAIAVEASDYAKKAFEQNTSHLEKLMGVKTLDKAVELNTEFAKASYESFVAQATRMGEMYTDLAKLAMKPVETAMAKVKVN